MREKQANKLAHALRDLGWDAIVTEPVVGRFEVRVMGQEQDATFPNEGKAPPDASAVPAHDTAVAKLAEAQRLGYQARLVRTP